MTIVADIDANTMFDRIDAAVNGLDYENAKVDALAHVGLLIAGNLSASTLQEIQDEILPEASAEYLRGYTKAWRDAYKLLL